MSGDHPKGTPVDTKKASTSTDTTQDENGAVRPNELDFNVSLPQSARRSVNRLENPVNLMQDNLESPPNQETVNEANALYLLMLSEQMRHLGLQLNQLGPFFAGPNLNMRRYRPGFWNARSLRALAEQFALSPQRRWVHEQAMNVDLDSLNFVTFQQLLNGLFEEGGVTWERVLVLFYFCTDISIRAFQEKFINHFLDIYNWTTVFLSGRFSAWVDAQGGWNVVLENSMPYFTAATITAAFSVVLGVCYVFFRRS